MVKAYVLYFNHQRPHQGIDQAIPVPSKIVPNEAEQEQMIYAFPVLGGLHTIYQRAA